MKIRIPKNKSKKFVENFFKKNDQHIFYLDDPVLGKYNKLQLDFYRS